MNGDKLTKIKELCELEYKKEPMSKYYNSKIIGYPSRLRVKKILKELEDVQGIVLDAAAEEGYTSFKIAEKGNSVVAVDISPSAFAGFEKKRKDYPIEIQNRILYYCSSIDAIPVADGNVNAVVCSETLEHTYNVKECIKEFSRVLSFDGKLIITLPNEKTRKSIMFIPKMCGIETDTMKETHIWEMSVEEIIDECKKYFQLEKHYMIPWYYPITHIMVFRKVKL